MTRLFHVTSTRNRESIRQHGLDWSRMAAAPGIAGSRVPEQDGCFLCLSEHDVDWFLGMNNTGGTADVWAVDGVPHEALVESPEGHYFVPYTIPPERLELVREDVEPRWARD